LRWLAALLTVLLVWPGAALAAEVLQVRGPTMLQLGDQNRSYTVQLACVEVADAKQAEAVAWLRQAVPRHTRVNLRPMGQNQGVLLARVQPLTPPRGSISQATDLGSGLISAGLAQADLLTTADCANVGG
jgi:endonuclease YncB( thermonuclease family)